MDTRKRWMVEIFIDQHADGTTQALARLDTNDDRHLHGHGSTRPNRGDAADPRAREHLAAAQALSELADRFVQRSLREKAS